MNQNMRNNYDNLAIFIACGFIGLALLLGQQINTSLSSIKKCENYYVTQKIFIKRGFRKPESTILVIYFNREYHKIISKRNYWESVSVGQKINVCIHKSQIGFDYYTLTDEE